jgi:hypothetical protein
MVICYDVLISADIQNHGSIICPRKFFNDDMLEELGVDEIKDKVNHK